MKAKIENIAQKITIKNKLIFFLKLLNLKIFDKLIVKFLTFYHDIKTKSHSETVEYHIDCKLNPAVLSYDAKRSLN